MYNFTTTSVVPSHGLLSHAVMRCRLPFTALVMLTVLFSVETARAASGSVGVDSNVDGLTVAGSQPMHSYLPRFSDAVSGITRAILDKFAIKLVFYFIGRVNTCDIASTGAANQAESNNNPIQNSVELQLAPRRSSGTYYLLKICMRIILRQCCGVRRLGRLGGRATS